MYMLIATVSKYWRTAGKLFRCKEIGVDITSICNAKIERTKGGSEHCTPTINQGLASCFAYTAKKQTIRAKLNLQHMNKTLYSDELPFYGTIDFKVN